MTTARRGTKANPFEVGERVRTNYFRGAANERERKGTVKKVDCFAGTLSFDLHRSIRYIVDWDEDQRYSSTHGCGWLTSQGLESIK